jgi:glutathione S-transferase
MIIGQLRAHDCIANLFGRGTQSGAIPSHKALTDYWARIKDRPARLAADAKDNALIPARTP